MPWTQSRSYQEVCTCTHSVRLHILLQLLISLLSETLINHKYHILSSISVRHFKWNKRNSTPCASISMLYLIICLFIIISKILIQFPFLFNPLHRNYPSKEIRFSKDYSGAVKETPDFHHVPKTIQCFNFYCSKISGEKILSICLLHLLDNSYNTKVQIRQSFV